MFKLESRDQNGMNPIYNPLNDNHYVNCQHPDRHYYHRHTVIDTLI